MVLNIERTIVIYDSKGRIIDESMYTGYDSWKGISRYLRAFDAKDNKVAETTLIWGVEANDWVPYFRFETAYGEQLGQQLNYESYYWVDGTWLGSYKIERDYSNGIGYTEVAFAWDTLAGQWVPTQKTHNEVVDNQVEGWTSKWDPVSGTWVVINKTRTVPVDDGPVGFNTTQLEVWTSEHPWWIPQYRTCSLVDGSGQQIEGITYQCDSTLGVGRWVVSYHSIVTYAAPGKPTFSLDSVRNYQTGELEPSAKSVLAYDERFNVTLQEYYTWQSWNGGWNGLYKQVQAYDEANRVINAETYLWEPVTSTWMGNQKQETTYASNGLPEENVVYAWVQTDPGAWMQQSKSRTTYNTANKETLVETFHWGGEYNPVWVPGTQQSTTYDDAFNRLVSYVLRWNSGTLSWDEFTKDTATYDAYNNVMYEHAYEWDTKLKEFKSKHSKRYYYSALNTGLEEKHMKHLETSVWYWTEKGRLHLINKRPSDYVQVFSLEGRLVLSTSLFGEDVSMVLPKGLYVVVMGRERFKVLVP